MNDQTESRPHIGQAELLPAEEMMPEFEPGSVGAEAVELGTAMQVPDMNAGVEANLNPPVVVTDKPNGGMQVVVEPNPLAMLSNALDRGHDVDKLGKLMDLAERHEANMARKSYAAAMSEFQGTCPPIIEASVAYVNTKDGGSYSYKYADLDNIMATIRPTLRACGLSVTYDTKIAEDGNSITSLCYVMHRDGHTEVRTFVSPVDNLAKMNDSQKMGSANSYASRYNVCNALGLSTGEDDDGAMGDTKRGAPPAPKATDVDEFFPIGKHKGQPWDQVPLDYLEWAVANLTEKPDIVKRCQEQIDARIDSQEPNPPHVEPGELSMAECARGIGDAKTSKDLAAIWALVPDRFVTSLTKYHETRVTELAA